MSSTHIDNQANDCPHIFQVAMAVDASTVDDTDFYSRFADCLKGSCRR